MMSALNTIGDSKMETIHGRFTQWQKPKGRNCEGKYLITRNLVKYFCLQFSGRNIARFLPKSGKQGFVTVI